MLPTYLPALAAVKVEEIDYKDGETNLQGLLAFDDTQKAGTLPVIIVYHEWWGINDYIRKRINQLAELGYLVFAADVYGKGIRPANAAEAGKQAGIYRNDNKLFRSRVNAAYNWVRNHNRADRGRIAAIGYCFGGGAALELARSGADLKAIVSIHGSLATPNPADARNIKGKVLVLHGGDDPNVPPEQVMAFEKEMREAKVDWQLNAYGGAVHAFSNPSAGNDPSKGSAYNAEADRKSWRDMTGFLAETLK